MQGTKYCGEAIHLNRAEWCRVEENRVYATGGNGIYLRGYNARNVICRNEIAYVGGNGVGLGGAWGFGDSMNADATPTHDHDLGLAESHLQYPLFNEILDNDIHHCGEIIYYAAGVFAALSEDNVIGHNAIHDTPQYGINLGSSGMSRNIVEYNDIRRTCRRTSDTGAINCWGDAQPRTAPRQGHIIRFNRIVDSGGNGLYLDDYTSNCYAFGNLIVGAKVLGIHVHGGKNNVLENNVIVGARDGVGFADFVSGRTPEMVNFCLGNRFCHNIVADCKRSVLWHYSRLWPLRSVSQSDDNLIFNSADGSAYLDSRRAEGLEANSLAADPQFVDPAHGDYRLKSESPAFGLGFQAIDFSRIGPRK